jgi:hypothetical protein
MHSTGLSMFVADTVVVPAWSAGSQFHMDVSGGILPAWMPAVHAGMTDDYRREFSLFRQANFLPG